MSISLFVYLLRHFQTKIIYLFPSLSMISPAANFSTIFGVSSLKTKIISIAISIYIYIVKTHFPTLESSRKKLELISSSISLNHTLILMLPSLVFILPVDENSNEWSWWMKRSQNAPNFATQWNVSRPSETRAGAGLQFHYKFFFVRRLTQLERILTRSGYIKS